MLNQGNYYNNIEGSLNVLNLTDGSVTESAFSKTNGRSLGDTPQCGLSYGSKIYLGVYESNTVEVLDKNTFKSISQIKLANTGVQGQQPRSMVSSDGYVYIAMYDGYVARLDTVTLTIDKSVKVGPNPEIMVLSGNYLYVPNSDGMNYPNYGTTASVVDVKSLQVVKTITVPMNPYQFFDTAHGLYLLCKGNYGDLASKLYKVESDNNISEVCDATMAAANSNTIVTVNDPFYGAQPAEYKIINLITGQINDFKFDDVKYAASLYLSDDMLFISSYNMNGQYPSYDTPGYVCVYDQYLKLIKKFNVGVGPSWIFSTTSKILM